ncbi:DNA-binding MarR family transcriptional regulator [Arthrobacter pigmenti]|uniref:DNA-binding MarR family transcriptional regulator n=1 Tax=Arthrobacter pigmenti TaxID=271432 RepID=A0A846RMN8_9MICC|nr:MarR family transcriptional regulator [Arthrobacter pigmenti]NJC21574.1 DNA-binding MarR family transcriptional regulator [Arthrobacter pigmenti]
MADTKWLTEVERTAWLRTAAVLELLPGALDAQLARDEDLTHFEYFVLASLSEAPGRTVRITALASLTNATLPRLSRVLTGLEKKALVERSACSADRRAKNVTLTETGWAKVVQSAPGHVENVRGLVFDQLTSEQVEQLSAIAADLLKRLDPEGRMFASTGENAQGR